MAAEQWQLADNLSKRDIGRLQQSVPIVLLSCTTAVIYNWREAINIGNVFVK